MMSKTAVATVSALVLVTSYVYAQARPASSARSEWGGCVSSTTEEGARSAYPAWYECQR